MIKVVVVFNGSPKQYIYRTNDLSIEEGDFVIVPAGSGITVARVVHTKNKPLMSLLDCKKVLDRIKLENYRCNV